MAAQIHQLGQMMASDVIAWDSAVIGVALTASVMVWVFRLMRA